jgi:hypothetical protein
MCDNVPWHRHISASDRSAAPITCGEECKIQPPYFVHSCTDPMSLRERMHVQLSKDARQNIYDALHTC